MKKKIFEIILTTLLIFIGINSVKADCNCGTCCKNGANSWICCDGSSTGAWGRSLTKADACRVGRWSNSAINAIRLSIVDNNGNRIPGTVSINFYSGGLPENFHTRLVSTDMKTRNEILSSGTQYTPLTTRPNMNYLNLPSFSNNLDNAAGVLKDYFVNEFSSGGEMIRVFQLMGYNAYNDRLLYENHILMIEPIFEFSAEYPSDGRDGCTSYDSINRADFDRMMDYAKGNNLSYDVAYGIFTNARQAAAKGVSTITVTKKYACDCNLAVNHYFGTASEIYYIMQHTNDPVYRYKAREGGSIERYVWNLGCLVHDDQRIGGLENAAGACPSKTAFEAGNRLPAYNNMLTTNPAVGLGSMHIWMKDILGNSCTDANGVEWQFQDDWTAEEREAFINLHCPSSTPSDEYCPTNSDHPEKMIPADKVGNETQKQQWIQENCYDNCANITSKIKSYDDGVINDCNNSNTINTFEDTDRWDCIYETINYATADTYAYEFYHPNGDTTYDNNPYCSIACRESISVSLPKEFEVVAGGRFTIGASNEYNIPSVQPNQIVGKTECFTAYPQRGVNVAGINLEQFKIDYKNADDAVAVAWDNYQIELAKQKSKDDVISTSEEKYGGDHNCKDTATQTYMTNEDAVRACHQLYFDLGIADASPCNAAAQYDTRTVGVPRENCPAGHFEHDGNPTWTYKTYTGRTYYYKNQPYQVTYDKSSDGQHDSIPNFDVDAKKRAYEQALAVRDGIFNKLMECNNFQRTFSEFEPKVSFAYSETKYRLESNQLAMIMNPITSESRYMVNNLMVGGSVRWNSAEYTNSSRTYIQNYTDLHGSISNDIHKYICNTELAVCSDDALTYPSNTSVGQFTTKVYEYELPENIYRYISKKDGISFNTYNEASLVNYPYDDVIDTGHSNLPISYETRPGYYNYFIDYYYAGGVPNLFGTNQKFYKYNQILPGSQSSFGGLTLANNLYYHCRYKVKCGLTEPCPDYCEACDGSIYPAGSSECNKACPPPGNKTCTDPCTGEAKEIPDGQKASDVCPIDCTNRCPDGSIKPPNGVCPCTNCGGIRIIYRPISLNDPFPGEHGNGRPSGANWVGETTVLGTTRSFIDAYITNNRGVTTEEVYKETPMYEFTLNASNIRAIRRYNNSKRDDYNDYDLNCINGKYCKSEFLEKGLASGYFNFSTEVPTGGTCLNAYSTNWESCRYSNIGG